MMDEKARKQYTRHMRTVLTTLETTYSGVIKPYAMLMIKTGDPEIKGHARKMLEAYKNISEAAMNHNPEAMEHWSNELDKLFGEIGEHPEWDAKIKATSPLA